MILFKILPCLSFIGPTTASNLLPKLASKSASSFLMPSSPPTAAKSSPQTATKIPQSLCKNTMAKTFDATKSLLTNTSVTVSAHCRDARRVPFMARLSLQQKPGGTRSFGGCTKINSSIVACMNATLMSQMAMKKLDPVLSNGHFDDANANIMRNTNSAGVDCETSSR